MSTVNERIRIIRKKLDLTQEDFANKIELKRSTLSNIERGNVTVTDRNIKNICRCFNVNEDWLTNGNGHMFNTMDEDKELLDFVIRTLSEKDTFVKNTFLTLARLSEEEWSVVEKIIKNLQKK